MAKKQILRTIATSCLLVGSLLWSGPAFPQAASGTITGTVFDPSGAVVPGVKIILTHVQQGVNHRHETNASGLYEARFLPPGEYTATAEAAGFKKAVQTGLVLVVAQTMRVDFRLEVGSTAQSVEVRANVAQLLKPETSEVGQIINYRQVVDLPLNGRNFSDLIALNVGVTTDVQGSTIGAGYNLNGSRSDINMFLIEGVDNISLSSTLVLSPSVDAIEEFNIQTGNFSAEFGRTAGGVVQVQLRSGTNSYHGTAFEFVRNDKLDANGFFDNQVPPPPGETSAPKVSLRQNQFGFSFGGPIRRDKLFFFGDYQGTRQRQGRSDIFSVPTLLERQGDFSQTLPPGQPIFQNALLGTRYPDCDPADFSTCQRIPVSAMDPPAVKLAQFYPAPNIPGTFVPGLGTFNNYAASASAIDDANTFDIKINSYLRERDMLSVRYSFGGSNSVNPAAFADGTLGPCVGCGTAYGILAGIPTGRSQNFGLTHVHTFTPNMVNEFRVGLNRSTALVKTSDGGKNLADEVGIANVNVSDLTSGLPWFYQIPIPTWIGTSPLTPQNSGQTVYQFTDNLSYARGKHRIRTGLDIRRRMWFGAGNLFGKGFYAFVPFFTGTTFGDFLTGRAAAIQQDLMPGTMGIRGIEYGSYVQDDFKVHPRLTLNLGVRYELFPGFVEQHDRLANLDPAAGIVRLAGKDGNPRNFVKTDKNNVAPRFGFAWTPRANGKTVLRGGYGISYVNTNNFISFNIFNAPFTGAFSLTNIDFTTFEAIYRLSDGLPIQLRPTVENFDPRNPAGDWNQNAPNQPNPYMQSFSFGIQRALPWDLLLDISYVGSRGVKLPGTMEGNPIPPGPTTNVQQRRLYYNTIPNVGAISLFSNSFSSNYHSLQVKAQKRYSHGLQFLASYTWAKSIDDVSTSSETGGGDGNPSGRPQDPFNPGADRSRSSFDIAHRLVLAHNYDLPFGTGRHFGSKWHPVVNGLLGGWQINGIVTLSTGLPFSVRASGNEQCGCTASDMRADRIGNGNLPKDKRSITGWFDKTAFTDPPSSTPTTGGGRYGNSGRNIIEGPGLANIDFSVFKKFRLGEKAELQFRGEFFNLFNHPNFLFPLASNATWQTGGLITKSRAPRIGQLALKVVF